MRTIKNDMKARARLLRGLANVLALDADYIWTDANNLNLVAMSESLHGAKATLKRINDCMTELEYYLYLINREDS